MPILMKVLFKAIGKMLIAFCAEDIIAYVIFWLLELAAKNSKTHFDDELVIKLRLAYDNKKLEAEKESG